MWSFVFYCFAIHAYSCFVLWNWKYIDQLLKIRDQYSKEHALESFTLGEMMLIMRKKPKEYKDLNRIYRAIQRCESEIKE